MVVKLSSCLIRTPSRCAGEFRHRTHPQRAERHKRLQGFRAGVFDKDAAGVGSGVNQRRFNAGFQASRAAQMVTQYRWLMEPAGLLRWRRRQP